MHDYFIILSIIEKYSCVKKMKAFVGKYNGMIYEHLFIILYLDNSEQCVSESEKIEHEILSLDSRIIVYSIFLDDV